MLKPKEKYSVVVGQVRNKNSCQTMDYYLGTDSVSLQEMLDIDIKGEVEGVIGGNPELGFNFTELSPLELDEEHTEPYNNFSGWCNSNSLLNCASNSSSSNLNLDIGSCDAASLMVNPNSVMPHVLNTSVESEKNFSRRSKSKPVVALASPKFSNHYDNLSDVDEICDNDEQSETEECENEAEQHSVYFNIKSASKINVSTLFSQETIKTAKIIEFHKQNSTSAEFQTILSKNKTANLSEQNEASQMMPLKFIKPESECRDERATSPVIRRQRKDLISDNYSHKIYPKPAYSYSCLIAMALKNSQTGSLPVSEIYNFMCEHFPYFKTAPNGWKNSVRHNLSLNKCFEKIEKPAGNSNQRKGCLWAINPSKLTKMDEEVQKWSKKDPMAIKRAMIYPDHLELLEKGEMKYMASEDLSEETESSSDETVDDSVGCEGLSQDNISTNYINDISDSFDEMSQDDENICSKLESDTLDMKLAIYNQFEVLNENAEKKKSASSPITKKQRTSSISNYCLYQTQKTFQKKTPFIIAANSERSFVKFD